MSNKINLLYNDMDVIAELSFEEHGIFLKFTNFIYDLSGKVYQVDHENFLEPFADAFGRNVWFRPLMSGLEKAFLTILGYIQGNDELPSDEVFKIVSPIIEKEKRKLSDFTTMTLRGGATLLNVDTEPKCTIMQLGGGSSLTHILVGFYTDKSYVREVRCPWKLLYLNKVCLFIKNNLHSLL